MSHLLEVQGLTTAFKGDYGEISAWTTFTFMWMGGKLCAL